LKSSNWFKSRGDWGGIILNASSSGGGSILRYVTVEYATDGVYIENTQNSAGDKVTIEDCTFQQNSSYGIYSIGQYANPSIKYSYIANNGTGIGIYGGAADIDNSEITLNTYDGIYVSACTEDNAVSINYSNILGNDTGFSAAYDLVNSAAYNIDAANNWWGTSDTSVIDSNIYDYNDNAFYGTVNYSPYNASYFTAGPR
jgi:hypothetical protein